MKIGYESKGRLWQWPFSETLRLVIDDKLTLDVFI